MIAIRGQTFFTMALVTLTTVMLHLTVDLSPVARFVPLSILVPTLLLLLVQLIRDLRSEEARLGRRAGQGQEVTRSGWIGGELRAILWMLLLLPSVHFMGFLVAIPAYTVVYLRARAGAGWLPSAVTAAAVWGIVYAAVHWTNVSLYEGWLWRWLSR